MRVSSLFLTASLVCSVSRSSAFVGQSQRAVKPSSSFGKLHLSSKDADESSSSWKSVHKLATSAATATTAAVVTAATPALAAGPDWGIFEGRIGSLLHPVMMGSLLLYSLYTGYLGLQWKRQRSIGDELKELQAQLPSGIKTVADVQAAVNDAGEGAESAKLKSYMPIAQQLVDLQQERKDLAAGNPRDKHFMQGSLLAFLGTCFAIEGPLNTYARAGKLFPGPHLYAGASLVTVWALAVATVPYMQKGNDTARTIHVAANVVGLILFGWQVQSGLPILYKVIEKTSWP